MHPRRYETLILLSPGMSPVDLDKFKAKVENILESGGARVLQTEDWGRKVLAYPVRKEHYGVYLLYDYQALPAVEAELKRNLKIDENVFKSLTLLLDRQFTNERFEQEKEKILAKAQKKEAPAAPPEGESPEASPAPAPEDADSSSAAPSPDSEAPPSESPPPSPEGEAPPPEPGDDPENAPEEHGSASEA
ncbi:MAG: 30S ribosomal protein S6 [Deltaproteobacteria bacterium]|jgi:small subunit ribosomal protein S6|nr:30S ribosomal protein S6 [Deltaproteobacteria bacterium]